MEAAVIERMAARGALPTFGSLAERCTALRLESCLTTFPEGIWAELTTERSTDKLGCYWHPRQVHAGEARQRALRAGDVDLTGFLNHAAVAGKRAAAIDLPRGTASPQFDGVELREWGTHERKGLGQGRPVQRPTLKRRLRRRPLSRSVPLEPLALEQRAGVLAEFAAAIREDREPEAGGRENLRSLTVTLAAVESARTGKIVDFAAFREAVVE